MLVWLLESTTIAALLAAIAALASRSKRLGPATRHLLWLLVIARLMTPAVLRWPIERIFPPAELIAGVIDPEAGGAPLSLDVRQLDFEPEPDAPRVESAAAVEPVPEIAEAPAAPRRPIDVFPWIVGAWAIGSSVRLAIIVSRIVAFRRRLARSSEMPAPLAALLDEVARSMGVSTPRARIVEGVGSPLLWCLGRPILVLPARLVDSIDPAGWRVILAHELAHLRRLDHWVGRLLMASEVVWWWHPLHRMALRRIEAEAELACDAWVVDVLPKSRRRFAETLVGVCESLSRRAVPSPALGVGGGPAHLLERRLLMILQERVSPRTSPAGLLALGLLAALSAPSWTLAQEKPADPPPAPASIPAPAPSEAPAATAPAATDDATAAASVSLDVKVVDGDTPEGKAAQSEPPVKLTVKIDEGSGDPNAKAAALTLPAGSPGQLNQMIQSLIGGVEVRLADEAPDVKVFGKPATGQSKVFTFERDDFDWTKLKEQILEQMKGVDPEVMKTIQAQIDQAFRELSKSQKPVGRVNRIEVRKDLKASAATSTISEAEALVKKAQAQLMEAQTRLREATTKAMKESHAKAMESRAFGVNSRLQTPGWASQSATRPAAGRAEDSAVEKRIDKLESKVDALLKEIKALREERSGEGSKTRALAPRSTGARTGGYQ